MNETQSYAALVLIVTVAKLIWEWVVSPRIRQLDKEAGKLSSEDRAVAKLQRDQTANYIAGFLLVLFSLLLLVRGNSDSDALENRLMALEKRIITAEEKISS